MGHYECNRCGQEMGWCRSESEERLMRRTHEQWEELAHKILRGDVDFAVLNDNTDCAPYKDRITELERKNRQLEQQVRDAGWRSCDGSYR